jgi:hypothetical protein
MTIPNKRVAVLSPVAWRTPPRQYGAWETVASNITEGLVARGWDVTLFASRDSVTRAHLHAVNLQLARAVRWIDQEADLMALVLRSLIELRFWAHFVSQGNDKAKHFLEEANTDSKDIYERLLKAFPEETTPYNVPPVVKRVNPTRIDDEVELLWKICSKFIHPTSFVLDTPETTILNEDYRKVFAVKVLYYGWGILEMFHPINWTD